MLTTLCHNKTLIEVFGIIANYGYNVRKNKENGLTKWQEIKNEISQWHLKDCPLIEIRDEFKNTLRAFKYRYSSLDDQDAEIQIGQYVMHNSIEKYHFVIQHIRIPLMCNFKVQFVKLMQIAYNIGQAKATFEEPAAYPKSLKVVYEQTKLSDLITYVHETYIEMQVICK